MRKYVALTVASVLFAGPVVAQSEVEDANGDGVYSMEELLVNFPTMTVETFAQIDANTDGVADPDELTAAIGAGLLDG